MGSSKRTLCGDNHKQIEDRPLLVDINGMPTISRDSISE